MQPYVPGQDVFQTQADQRFNSFSDPMNGVNMNPGNWGMNPYYLTPSYLSPYRPQYQGPQGNQYPNQPGFFRSVNHLFNPLESGGTNYGGSIQAQNQPYYNQTIHRPMDAIVAATQKAVLPAALTYAAYRYTSSAAGAVGAGLASGTMQGALGRYAATSMGSSAIAGARVAGGLFGTAFLPMALATGAMAGVDAAIFDPYTSQRQVSNNLRENFSGVYMGGGMGNSITGRGLGVRNSADIAHQIARMGAKDLTFDQNEMATLTDYSARSGLLDNAQGGQIVSRMKDIVKQVKTVMSVANTSDFKEAVEIIAKMQQAGASGIGMNSALAGIGANASMAGISAQRLMATTGLQGQFMFQANGMTPYVGMSTAGAAHGSMASAFRTGLISPALMARMGGVEGATQSSVAGLVATLQSPYSGIRGMNAYFGQGEGGSIVQNMAQFGNRMASNPMAELGRHNMMRQALASRLAEDRGVKETHDIVMQLAQANYQTNSDGRVDAGVAYQYMTGTMGLTHEQAIAQLNQIKAGQDPETARQMLGAIDAQKKDFNLQWANQNGLKYGIFTPMVQGAKKVGREVQAMSTDLMAPLLRGAGSLIDWGSEAWTNGMHGIGRVGKAISREDLTEGLLGTSGRRLGGTSELAGILNKLSGEGNELAKAAMFGSGAERRRAVEALQLKGHLKGDTSSIIRELESINAVKFDENSVNTLGERAAHTLKLGGSGGSTASGNAIADARLRRVNYAGGFGGTHSARGFKNDLDILDLGKMSSLLDKYKEAKASGNAAEADSLAEEIKRIKPNADLSINREGQIVEQANLQSKLTQSGLGGLKDAAGEIGYTPEQVRDIVNNEDAEGLARLKRAAAKKYGKVANSLNFTNLQSGLAHLSGATAEDSQAGSSGDTSETARRAQVLAGLEDQKNKIRRLRDTGRIDFSQATNMENALDNKESVLTFKEAVNVFASAVAVETGKAVPGATTAPSSGGWFSSIFK